jgi:hypothetical protein
MAVSVFRAGGAGSRSRRRTPPGGPRVASAFCAAALAFGAGAGCGGEPEGKTDLAKLPPPPPTAAGRAKAPSPTKAPPKFGSPPAKRQGEP